MADQQNVPAVSDMTKGLFVNFRDQWTGCVEVYQVPRFRIFGNRFWYAMCGEDYLGRISGPLMDRFDLRVDVPPVDYTDLDLPADGESSDQIARRVASARDIQDMRYSAIDGIGVNADAEGSILEEHATPDAHGRAMLNKAAETFGLTARGYHRVLRVARTIADLDGSATIGQPHIAEAISFRIPAPSA